MNKSQYQNMTFSHLVEMLLQFFICQIDTELLKAAQAIYIY